MTTSRSDQDWAARAVQFGSLIERNLLRAIQRGEFNPPTIFYKEGQMALNRNPNAAAHEAGKAVFFVIWGPGHPNPPEQTFDTAAEAWDVAEVMASKHDGRRFFVLQAIGSCCVEKPITRRELVGGKEVAP